MMTREEVKKSQTVEARARNISPNVPCTECGSQSIEDSQADIVILLKKWTMYKNLWQNQLKNGRAPVVRFIQELRQVPKFRSELANGAITLTDPCLTLSATSLSGDRGPRQFLPDDKRIARVRSLHLMPPGAQVLVQISHTFNT